MNREVLIVCESMYHGNTRRIAEAMARKINCRVMSCTEALMADISKYRVIGLGSGIYFTTHHPRLFTIASRMSEKQKAFIFSTHGAPVLGKYHSSLKKMLSIQKVRLLGEFSCKGYDCTGPYNIINGGNKGRPNEADQRRAARFVQRILPEYAIDTEHVNNSRHIQIRYADCLRCGKCTQVCPMNVFSMGSERIYITSEEECVHCSLCTENCPQKAIAISHSWLETIKIARRHAKRTSL